MSREVRRVPTDFNHRLRQVWPGYLMPKDLRLPECPDCNGRGYSPEALHLLDLWYVNASFKPEDNGSTPHSPDSPPVRAIAERNIERAPEYYGTGELAIQREAARLAEIFNRSWCYHLNADDVAALIADDRLWHLTREFTPGKGWHDSYPPKPTPTPTQVNDWAIRTTGHDSSSASVAVDARCNREGLPSRCATCDGKGNVATDEQQAAYDQWEPTEPPTGEGWQLWETTSEGSPISPVFATGNQLAAWMSKNPCGFANQRISLETAMKWVHGDGWSPSMIHSAEHGVEDGITFMARTAS